MMKVLMVNGSPHIKGCTYTALEEVGKTLKENGVDYEIFQLGPRPIRDCIGCNKCRARAVSLRMTMMMPSTAS